MAWKTVTAGLVLLLLPSPTRAQEDSLPSGTYAQRGLIVGSMAGAAAGAFLVGLLSYGLCEYECDGALLGGALVGGGGGAVLGGLTGLVVDGRRRTLAPGWVGQPWNGRPPSPDPGSPG